MNSKLRRINALHGALVADAAAMGMHWIYDQDHIQKIEESGDIIFRQPDSNNYQGVKSYFAHAAKRVGQYSQYGESAQVVARVISHNGKYSVNEHQQLFFKTFGPCGSYHGFADRPTKALIHKMIANEDNLPEASGSDDDQLPALCSVPALFTNKANIQDIANAVSVTSVHEQALSGAQVLNDCLNRIYSGENLSDALSNSAANGEAALAELMNEAMAKSEYQPLEIAQQFGLACHMPQGLPVAWHLLQHAKDFEQVIRDNIRCGGDSCGRSMAVGSIAGLVYGVPNNLKMRVESLR